MGIITLDRKKIFYLLFCVAFFGSLQSIKAQCPTVTNLNQSFCDVESPTIASLAATSNGNGVVWYATATSTTPLSPASGLADGEDYFADDNSGTCGTRPRVVVTVYARPFAQSFQGPCVDDPSDATIADLTATGNNIQWYLTASGGTPLPSTTVLADNTFYYASQTNPDTGCETSRRPVLVTVGVVPIPTGDPIQSFCNIPGNPPTLNDVVVSGDNNWYATASSAVPIPLSTQLVNGQSYFATTVDPPCESSTRFEVQVNLVAPNNAGTNGTRSICVNELATTPAFNLFALLGGTPNNTGTWSGPLTTANGFQGTVNVSTLTLAGSPYTFTYTVSSALCPTATSTVIITVLPVPTVAIAANTTICSGTSATVTFTGTPNAAVTYNINSGPNQTINLNGSGTATITNTYTTTTTFNLVSVASTSTPACSQTQTGSVTINVLPPPTVTLSPAITVCPNGSATVTFTGTPNATITYTVNSGPNQTITLNAAGAATITQTYTATTTYTLVSAASATTPVCTNPQTGSMVVTVRPLPTVAISGTANVCTGGSATVTFTGTPNAIVTYTVNSGPNQTINLNAAGTATITNTFTATTTYTLVSVVTSGLPACSQPQTGSVVITVLPPPTATIAANNTICSGSSATVTFTGTPNATVTYNINGGGSQTIVLNAAGTATLTNTYTANAVFNLVSAASSGTPSCTQPLTGSITITVRPLPTVTASGNATICPNTAATVTFTGTPNAIITYTVNSGPNQTITLNATGTATLTNTYTATTVYTIVSAATGGTPNCSQPQTGTVTVTVTPLPTVTISGTANVCPNGAATITFTGTPNATVTYTVNSGPNQTIALNAGGTATITGNYTVTTVFTLVGVATSGTPSCSQPQTGTATISVTPLPTATIASSSTICIGASATVTFTGTPNAIVTYTVNSGPNQTITLNAAGTAAITQAYSATTVFTLVSVATAGTPSCSQPATGTITITVVPPPTVAIAANANICSGGSATVTFTGTPNATVTYTINGGGNQTIVLNAAGTATITNTYTATTIFNLVSIASTGTPGCSQPQTGSVTITVIPPPTVTIAANTTICSGQSATVSFTGTPNATVTYNINSGPNQTILLNAAGTATLTNTYTTNTTINLISVATSGTPSCSQPATGSVTITVLPLPVAAISATTTTICSGTTGTVTFTGTPNATVTYTINGGGNQTIVLNAAGTATLTNTYTATAIFNLVSVATTGSPGCSQPQTGTVTITVVPPPTVTASSSASTICSGGSATVTFTGTPNATVTYNINGGGSQTIVLNASGTATITNTYTATTVFTITGIATSGTPSCTLPQNSTITINVTPLPTATVGPDANICSGQSATLTFTGTPNAIVTYTVNSGPNQTITLGAAGTATLTNTYTANTTITLVSVATAGTPSCSQPLSGGAVITVLPVPTASIIGGELLCSGENATVEFEGTPFATITYTINNGPELTIVLDDEGHAEISDDYTATTTFTLVSVTSPGPSGCVLPVTGSVTIEIIPLPTVTITSDVTICSGGSATVTFNGSPDAQVTYNIDGGDDQIIVLDAAGTASITNTYTATTVFNVTYVTLTGTPSCNQDVTGSVTITVEPIPTVTISGDATVCSGDDATITFSGTPNATVTYTVNGDTNTVTLDASGNATVTIPFTANSVINLVSITTAGSPGCTQTVTGTVTITVAPLPTVSIIANTNVCAGQASTITFNGTPGATVTYNINNTGDQTVVLDASGTATITNTFTANATIALVSIQSSGTPSCTSPLADVINITVNPLPTVAITTVNTTICSGSVTAVRFVGTPNTIVTYTANGNTQTINIGPSGIAILTAPYTVTTVINIVSVALANPPSCSQPQTGTVTITVTQPPNAGSNAVLPLCGNSAPQDLFLLLGPTAQTGGTWSPALASGTGVFNPAVDTAGTYVYTVVGTPPCINDTASASVTVTPQTDAGTDGVASLCSNTDPIDLFTFLGGTPQPGGTWSPALPSGTGVLNPGSDAAGVYTYTVVGVAPCVDDSSTVTVSITPGPDAGISGSLTLCANSAAQDLFASLGGTPQVGGTWSPAMASGTGVFDPAVDAAGVYTYTFSGNQPCDDDTATVTVTVSPIPNAGVDGTAIYCSNYAPSDLIAFLGATAQPGGTWSPALASGTGIFNPLVDAAGTYTYTVGGGLCSTDTAEVVVTVFQSPNAGGLGATLLINSCITSTSVDLFTGLSGSQGIGTWNDDDGSGAQIDNIFNPSIAGVGTYHFTYTVTGGISPCVSDSATVTVVVDPTPNSGTFSGVQSICTSVGTFDLATLLTGNQTGGVWTDSSNVVVTSPIDVSTFTAGTYDYTYTITNTCGTDTETVQLTILPNPVLNLPDVSVASPVCVGQNAVVSFANMTDGDYTLTYDLSVSNILAGQTVNLTIAGGNGTFDIPATSIPNTGITTVTFLNIASATTSCSTIIADVSANFTVSPLADLVDANLNIANACLGSDAVVTISGATGLPDGDYTFDYSIPTATPDTGTTGTVTVTGGAGQFNIPAASITAAGNYTLTITAITSLTSGCNNTSENAVANFTVNPVSDVADVDLSIANTCLGSNATVQISGATGLPDGDYTFDYSIPTATPDTATTGTVTITGGAGQFDIPAASIATAGNYTMTITAITSISGGCNNASENASATFTVTPASDLVDADLSIANVCTGSNATVQISATGLTDGDYTFDYSIPTATPATGTTGTVTITGGAGQFDIPSASIATAGNYTLTITAITSLSGACNNASENASATFTVTPSSDLVDANLGIANVCSGTDAVVLISGATGLADGNYTFDYSIPTATPTTATTGTVAIASGAGQFNIPAAMVTAAGNYTMTITAITSLSGSCNNASENAAATFTILALPNVTGATLNVVDSCFGFANVVGITGATGLADGNYDIDYTLTGANTATTTVTVAFTGGNASFTIPATDLPNLGTVTLTVSQIIGATNQCGSVGAGFTASFDIAQPDDVVLNDKGNEFCSTDMPRISNLSANISGNETVVWYDAPTGGNQYADNDLLVDGTTYYAALQNAAGCESATRLPVEVDLSKCNDIVIPDGFSPNGDGVNEDFFIRNLKENYPNFKLEIYNRYGNIVYKGNRFTPNWDGTTTEGGMKLGNSLLPTGVYFYILEFNDGVRDPKQGRVYLNR
jgi:mucin-2